MIIPPFLHPKDSVGILSTARKISHPEIIPAIRKFEDWGLHVKCGKNLHQEFHQFAGTDKERLSDFQQMLDDDSIKAIICARGGYGTVRFIDKIDFSEFTKKPKWIVGYSDITILHSHIQKQCSVATLHATMPLNFPADGIENSALRSLKKALFGEMLEYKLESSTFNRKGIAKGILVGGNLSILHTLNGTPSQIGTDGKILFIEDLDEYLYHIDRMMLNLKRCGMLKNIAGLIVGGMTEMKDNTIPFGKSAYEIVAETIAEYNYPVCFGFPAGHIPENNALIFGKEITLEVTDKSSVLKF